MGPCHGDVQLGHKMSESPQIKHPRDPWISIGHWAVHSPTSGLNAWVTNLISVILFSLASLPTERRASFVKLLHVGGTSSSEKTAHISVGNCSPKKQNTHTHTHPSKPPEKHAAKASSHCRSVLFQTSACLIQFCHRGDFPKSCVISTAFFTYSLRYS